MRGVAFPLPGLDGRVPPLHASGVEWTKRSLAMEGRERVKLDRCRPTLSGTDADALIHGENKNLAVSNFSLGARTASLENGVNRRLDEFVIHGNLQLHLP